jgi:hypothetical protein
MYFFRQAGEPNLSLRFVVFRALALRRTFVPFTRFDRFELRRFELRVRPPACASFEAEVICAHPAAPPGGT